MFLPRSQLETDVTLTLSFVDTLARDKPALILAIFNLFPTIVESFDCISRLHLDLYKTA